MLVSGTVYVIIYEKHWLALFIYATLSDLDLFYYYVATANQILQYKN